MDPTAVMSAWADEMIVYTDCVKKWIKDHGPIPGEIQVRLLAATKSMWHNNDEAIRSRLFSSAEDHL
jgi:hypothetical protein